MKDEEVKICVCTESPCPARDRECVEMLETAYELHYVDAE